MVAETFTEEQARDKLIELGFDVVDARDSRFMGYSIELQGNGTWIVFELVKHTNDAVGKMNLSGWKPSLVEALQWLQARIKEGRA